ncbi:MAG TPA: excinuclease ABC subunit UvrA [Candidatus Kapabacteria bacterium]|nr:excinuclease ABC subunit UvrA [Candidatus Kapabacteria bacterium]
MKGSKTKNNVKYIEIKNARTHNLKNVSAAIPRNKLTVITGVSGSGKSSLAFDTLYAEGQRRFVESLSAYARQFLERISKPDVDSISGLPPAIAIGQNPPARNPRSTVGTTTVIYDYIRLLYARIGVSICHGCGKTISKDSPQSIVDSIFEMDEGSRIYILFAPNNLLKVDEELKKAKKFGFNRVIDINTSEMIDIHEQEPKWERFSNNLYFVVDRLVLRKDEETRSRLIDSVETAFNTGQGRCAVLNDTTKSLRKFSNIYECADCGFVYEEPEPRLFSFNNPKGACPHCQGFGRTMGIDEDLVVPNKSLSIGKDAIYPLKSPSFIKFRQELFDACRRNEIDLSKPYNELTEKELKVIWDGDALYGGVNGFFKMLEENNYKVQYRIILSKYRGFTRCKHCGGARLRTSARQVFVGGKNIPEIIQLPLEKLLDFFQKLELTDYQKQVSEQILQEIVKRLQLLVDIGLGYLTLSRLTHTLSGGESQRINLATALGSALVGTLYVLDEPSQGLHPRDTDRLVNILFKLRNIGNTIVVVEHDPDIIRKADYIIDIGPRAGSFGGEIVFNGTYDKMMESENSLTALYLSGKVKIPLPQQRRKISNGGITFFNVKHNNLDIEKITFPLNAFVVVTGVSGSGKSSLVYNVLYAGLKKQSGLPSSEVGQFSKVAGSEKIKFVEMVDQSNIGISTRSTPATYTKVFDTIREVFAQTQASRQLGLRPGYFSFNVPGGRCDVCEGEGYVTVDMQFLPDVRLVCEACGGTRYKKEARNIYYNGKNIVDVLNMTVDEAAVFFYDHPKIVNKLGILQKVGLGYLKLGQSSSMLSGGESQRIKLATHLDSSVEGHTLFIFDEPTTGLHLDDISKLLTAMQELVEQGHSVVVIEHNLHIIAAADWIIDLGPEAGELGGRIVAEGPPERIAKAKNSHTGEYLRKFFENEYGLSL